MTNKAPTPPPKNQRKPEPPPAPPRATSAAAKHLELIKAARALALRTKKYVSVNGKRPTDEVMDCDIEMWDLAEAVLVAIGESK